MSKTLDRFAGKMAQMGLESAGDILLYAPRAYTDLIKPLTGLRSAIDSEEAVYLKLRLRKTPELRSKNGRDMLLLELTDGQNTAFVSLFGGFYAMRSLKAGDYVFCTGRVRNKGDLLTIDSFEWIPESARGQIVPVYTGMTDVVSSDGIRNGIAKHFDELSAAGAARMQAILGEHPDHVLKKLGSRFADTVTWLAGLHRPVSLEQASEATETARLFNGYFAVMASRLNRRQATPAARVPVDINHVREFVRQVPWKLTYDQRRAAMDIITDLQSDVPMDRVLSGEVGSGKTLAYALPAVAAWKVGKQAVILTPNELLASQIADNLRTWFQGVPVVMCTKGNPLKGALSDNAIVVGTSAIINWLKKYNIARPDLVIVDEQQKFGARQKEALIGEHTNFLEATATMIPRTTAQIRYGGRDISLINEIPVKKNITTQLFDLSAKKAYGEAISAVLQRNEPIAIIYPLREEPKTAFAAGVKTLAQGEALMTALKDITPVVKAKCEYDEDNDLFRVVMWGDDDQVAALEAATAASSAEWLGEDAKETLRRERLTCEWAAKQWEDRYPGRVVMIYGQMKPQEKVERLEQFKRGEKNILISTTVIEVGVTMPELRNLAVNKAEQFGTSTLHQIRGRLARQGGEGQFLLFTDKHLHELTPEGRERLKLLCRESSGIRIAEMDLQIRGAGDVARAGVEQAGKTRGIFKNVPVSVRDMDDLFARLDNRPGRNQSPDAPSP